ncbi:Heat shock 70 kDa protein [Lachnellula hyalina]|uniref:Heat shock 70 kDa protein n=1 Tax=Lachnellula hyalina TaxID=1316788 RepID=A0A8H8U214_9HELO|nr:Heat shock 70 kDa protein [Lachnellula hyalina]TVY30987.1 Heat shock 70 kDa protein [Lachnellula hyalina]
MDSTGKKEPQVVVNRPKVYESEDKLVIGLDFGTTFSGIAYAFSNERKPDLVSIMDWPGLEGNKQPKVPTVICYDEADKTKFTWGGMKHPREVVPGIKLLLDPDQPGPLYLPESSAKSDLKSLGKPAVDVAADFIGAMYKHAISRIESKVPSDYLEMCQKQFVLSVPAVWSDKAKNKTLQAAKRAGIHPISLIKEPEAAAMYTLHGLKDKMLAVGDAFVICDAGGGTVDLISYEITALSPKLELKKLVPGKGGMVGSLGLNKRFEQSVKELVGEDQYYHLQKTTGFAQATPQFDRSIKTAFRGSAEEDYFVNFPMAKLKNDPVNNLEANFWNIKGDDAKKIFDPLINDIERLVEEQVNLVTVKRMSEGHPKATEVKAIFLVGGFGSSEYLKARLQGLHKNIQIIQPHDAWSAIVKGAVLSQLPQEASVVSTQSLRHYGVSAMCEFDPKNDEDHLRVFSAPEGIDRVERMTWYIHKGEDLQREQTIHFPFFHSLAVNYTPDDLIFSDELIQSESKDPPLYPAKGSTSTNCVLEAYLKTVDPSKFKKKTGADGKEYHDVFYELAVTMKPATMRFALTFKGEEMGSLEANYD